MTEKTIIDGVDVSQCEFKVKPINSNEIRCHCVKSDCFNFFNYQNMPESIKSSSCKENPNCHYKQLKRKEESLQELQKAYSKLSQRYENKGWSKEYEELKSELQAEKQKVEELEEELTFAKKDMCQKCDFQKEYFSNTKKLMKEKYKYKQALEEIKELAKIQCVNGCNCIDKKQILQKCEALENAI